MIVIFQRKNKEKEREPRARSGRLKRVPAGKIRACLMFLVVLLLSISFFSGTGVSLLKAGSFGWIQDDWSGEADTASVATHTANQSGWQEYYAKSSNVTAGADAVTLVQPEGSFVQTTVEDFSVNDLDSEMYLDAESGSMTLKKANGRGCAADAECREAYCLSGVCTANPFIYGICSGIGIYPSISPTTYQWKTADNKCNSPQCVTGQLLVSDPSVDFSAYPAQQYCVSLGARLPTRSEVDCMYTNRNAIGGFIVTEYWSNEGIVSSYYYSAYAKTFDTTTGGQWYSRAKNSYRYVRCVRNQS